jgi:hypothetical protein
MQFFPRIKNLGFRAFEMLEKIGVSSKPRRCAKPPGTDAKPTEFDGNRHQAIEEAESAFWMLPDALAPKCFPLGSQNRRHVRSSCSDRRKIKEQRGRPALAVNNYVVRHVLSLFCFYSFY